MLHYILCLDSFVCRGSTASRYGPSDPLPGRRVSFSHHCDRLPDEAHLDDHDRCLQVCQNQEAHHLPEPQLHGSAVGVRGGPQQWNNATNPHTEADWCGDGRLNESTLLLTRCFSRDRLLCALAWTVRERESLYSSWISSCAFAKSLGQRWWQMPKIPTVWTWPKSRRRRRVGEIEWEEAVSGNISSCDCEEQMWGGGYFWKNIFFVLRGNYS